MNALEGEKVRGFQRELALTEIIVDSTERDMTRCAENVNAVTNDKLQRLGGNDMGPEV